MIEKLAAGAMSGAGKVIGKQASEKILPYLKIIIEKQNLKEIAERVINSKNSEQYRENAKKLYLL